MYDPQESLEFLKSFTIISKNITQVCHILYCIKNPPLKILLASQSKLVLHEPNNQWENYFRGLHFKKSVTVLIKTVSSFYKPFMRLYTEWNTFFVKNMQRNRRQRSDYNCSEVIQKVCLIWVIAGLNQMPS